MSTLSIFVDESGEFGTQSEYYVLAMVLHNQTHDITDHVNRLVEQLRASGQNTEWAIHTGAAVRGEEVYREASIEDRRREFSSLFAFARRVPVIYQAFTFRKREHPDRHQLIDVIEQKLSRFLHDNAGYLLSFDQVIVYYDNGQAEITNVLNTVLNDFSFEVDFRRVLPAQYRLFQVADLCCTLELLRAKVDEGKLSHSDLVFFETRRALRKDYLSKLDHKRFPGSD